MKKQKLKSKIKYFLENNIFNINKKIYLINLNVYKYKTKIIKIFDKKGKKINFIKENIEGIIILKKTSFFFESCGQISDIGYIYNDIGKFKVFNVKKYKNLYLHIGILLKGNLFIDNNVKIYIDKSFRYKISINHYAIHLLNETLKRVLNINLVQKRSLINENKLTFDFFYYKNISNEKLFIIEKLINNEIFKKNSYSKEVCNGLHVKNTKNIGIFCIILEKSISKGIRRIEALTNKNAINYILKNKLIINNLSYNFKQNINNIENNILNIINKKNIYIDTLKKIKILNIKYLINFLLNKIFYLYEYKILIKKINIDYKKDLFLIINNLLKFLLKKSIIIIYIINNNNIYLFIKITNDFFNKITSNVILNNLLKKNIFYKKNNFFSYINTNIKNIKNLKKIKKIIKTLLKV